MTEPLRVACAVEGEAYVGHCAAMLHSLLVRNADSPLLIHYLHGDDTSSRGRTRLGEMVRRCGGEIHFHAVPERLIAGLPVKGFTRKATWYRIFLPELLPDASRVLYLDADLIVTDSLLPLWHTELRGHLLGAVTNVMMEHDLDRPTWLGLPSRDSYFNAGVLLMDLELMRQERTTEELRSFSVSQAERLGWRDQDALNLILHDRRLPLHPRWNCMNAVMQFPWAVDYFGAQALEEARRHPAIRHYEGPGQNKPWHLLCEPAERRLYAGHRRDTPWPRVVPSGCTPANLVRYARRRTLSA